MIRNPEIAHSTFCIFLHSIYLYLSHEPATFNHYIKKNSCTPAFHFYCSPIFFLLHPSHFLHLSISSIIHLHKQKSSRQLPETSVFKAKNKSAKRDSNTRPRPWILYLPQTHAFFRVFAGLQAIFYIKLRENTIRNFSKKWCSPEKGIYIFAVSDGLRLARLLPIDWTNEEKIQMHWLLSRIEILSK